ncbi:phosphotransferase [Propionivibrio limicola]|uniref:phosphotransferase n=1 Tax=Propionivibrio limicola TaxID=167645 RepID=UPI00129241F4|nr:phosphotransferase [Propionivibrio limicola]
MSTLISDHAEVVRSEKVPIEKVLSGYFGGVDVSLGEPINIQDNSEVFRATIATQPPRQAAVKRCFAPRTRTPDVSTAAKQFEALARVEKALSAVKTETGTNQIHRVPEPICLIPELAIFAMGWSNGESLTRKLSRPAILTKRSHWLHQAGEWLGYFHTAGPLRPGRINLDHRLEVIAELEHLHSGNDVFAKATHRLRETAPRLANGDAWTSWLHGDCKTDNFLIDGNAVIGIDISLAYENTIEYDLAQFLNNLELTLNSPRHLVFRGLRRGLVKAFLSGYRQTGPSISDAYLDWIRLDFALSLWDSHIAGRRPNMKTWVLERVFSALVRRLTTGLDSLERA